MGVCNNENLINLPKEGGKADCAAIALHLHIAGHVTVTPNPRHLPPRLPVLLSWYAFCNVRWVWVCVARVVGSRETTGNYKNTKSIFEGLRVVAKLSDFFRVFFFFLCFGNPTLFSGARDASYPHIGYDS